MELYKILIILTVLLIIGTPIAQLIDKIIEIKRRKKEKYIINKKYEELKKQEKNRIDMLNK